MRPTSDPNPRHRRELRLVHDAEAAPRPESSASDARARSDQFRAARRVHREWEVGAENRAAAGLPSLDARRVMAVRVSDALEGGRAAILRPEARARLVSSASRMGLRPFDANMVIAIVQDAARRGEDPRAAEHLSAVGAARPGPRPRTGPLLLLSAVLAAAWAAFLLLWLRA